MTPTQHLPEEYLLAYAGGSASEAVALVVATHLTLCAECRSFVEHLESMGGGLLETVDENQVSDRLLQNVMDRLDQDKPTTWDAVQPTLIVSGVAAALPRTLWPYLETPEDSRWRRLLPGLRQLPLTLSSGGVAARLLKIHRGRRIPLHGHRGCELTLVLSGALIDNKQVFGVGDVAVRGPEDEHEILIPKHEDCVCLIVNDAQVIPKTWLGKLVQVLF